MEGKGVSVGTGVFKECSQRKKRLTLQLQARPGSRFCLHLHIIGPACLSRAVSRRVRPMNKLALLMVVLALTSGCEMIQTVPPARGRVVEAGSGKPISHAEVVRVCSDTTKKTTTDKHGDF